MNKLILGNSLKELKELEDNSIDSIVTDPPYELGFMGKSWDNTGIANNPDLWAECLRVLKPGGHLLAFSGTRTYHRMAVAIEDAGFEVRDMIEWVYGSGFPKSLNIGKAVDKLQGNEREVTGEKIAPDGVPYSKRMKEGHGPAYGDNTYGDYGNNPMNTKGTSPYEGWGTALKPAHEPICMARKPLAEKTVAQNVLKYGTGGINIDESRVEAGEDHIKNATRHTNKIYRGGFNDSPINSNASPLGRFPANLIHDNSDEVRECFPESKTGSIKPYISKDEGMFGMMKGKEHYNSHEGDSGNASRFFKSITETKGTSEWEGWGTALKPAHEPICMARKPLAEKTVAQNVLKYGTGGINIDESRVEYTSEQDKKEGQSARVSLTKGNDYTVHKSMAGMDRSDRSDITGRFPANLIHDNSEEVRECFPETKSGAMNGTYKNTMMKGKPGVRDGKEIHLHQEASSGSASRFFKSIIYQAKASKSERNKGCEGLEEKQYSHDGRDKEIENAFQRNKSVSSNNHPTVKPIALMEYLIKMVTPKSGTVLDPFMGSGSTGVAAKQNGYDFIGIDMTPEYIEIAKARINHYEDPSN